ncbi:hypothetical protein EDB85DRAFT_1886874 [Lactarius pseudohatsudake]|nr:hypothetical protein EDB85DRAFT_1886874 [Lactarius pseudohatsudake]
MPGLKFALTLAAAACAIYFFGGEDGAPPPSLNLYLVLTLAAAAYVIGEFLVEKRTTLLLTPESDRPPPQPLSYNYHLYRPPPVYAYGQTAPWSFASPDHDSGVYPSHYTPKSGRLRLIRCLFDTIVWEDLEFAKKQREIARWHGREMAEAYSRAKSAQRMGDHSAAQEHRQQGDAHKTEMEHYDAYATSIIFCENNKNRRDAMIDLHGLYVVEAVEFADELLHHTRSRGDEVAHFIVGKVLRSGAGRAKIRPALEDLFTKRGLDYSLDPRNTGVLVVRLD